MYNDKKALMFSYFILHLAGQAMALQAQQGKIFGTGSVGRSRISLIQSNLKPLLSRF